MHRTAKNIMNHIRAHDGFLIVPHRQPDGDALGSATAVFQFLQSLGKTARIYCATDYPASFDFLHGLDAFTSDAAVWKDSAISTVITVDASDPEYAGISERLAAMPEKPTVIVFDHHATNKLFGDMNMVLPHAASTTEILYSFFRSQEAEITADMATSLLTGILTDTGYFSNSATSRGALKIAGELLRLGARMHLINSRVLHNKTVPALKLWGIVLSRLASHAQHDIAYTYYSRKDVSDCGAADSDGEGIANMLNLLTDCRAAMVIREKEEGGVKVSMRTSRQGVDVSAIAVHFGGGGHIKAAGFDVELPMEAAISHIFENLKKNTDLIQ